MKYPRCDKNHIRVISYFRKAVLVKYSVNKAPIANNYNPYTIRVFTSYFRRAALVS